MARKIPQKIPSKRAETAADPFARGIAFFNSARFFEAHEAWEEIWLHSHGREKAFLQGLIQLAAAFHHASRGNRAGMESLLRAGLEKLEELPASYRGIALAKLRTAARKFLSGSLAEQESARLRPPRISHLSSTPGTPRRA